MRLRRRFADVVERQLSLFATDYASLLDRIAEAREAYVRAPRTEAEYRFAEYQAWVSDGTDALADLRDGYASTLDEDAAAEYEAFFNRAVLQRFGDLALEIEDDDL